MTNSYDDIINLPHHISPSRTHMSAHDRAAQFSPFAALTGYGLAITETGRLTDRKVDLDEYSKIDLNEKLSKIQDQIDELPEVIIAYFQPDKKKPGGTYITTIGCVKKIDAYERVLIMQDDTKILIDNIFEIGGEPFGTLEYDE